MNLKSKNHTASLKELSHESSYFEFFSINDVQKNLSIEENLRIVV